MTEQLQRGTIYTDIKGMYSVEFLSKKGRRDLGSYDTYEEALSIYQSIHQLTYKTNN